MVNLLQGDCLELLGKLPNESVDLTVTSPPYDNLRTYNGAITQWDFNKFQNVAQELFRVTVNGGVVVWIVADATIRGTETGNSFKQALYFKDCGFNLHDTMIWYKESCPFPDKTRYYQSFEYMFVFSKGTPRVFNPIEDRVNKWGGTKVHGTLRQPDGSLKTPTGVKVNRRVKDIGVRFNVWPVSPERKNKTGHPAVFPERLVTDHIHTWSNPDAVILDPFMGSGTTGVATVKTGRNFIGIEIEPTYFDIASRRIRAAQEEALAIVNQSM